MAEPEQLTPEPPDPAKYLFRAFSEKTPPYRPIHGSTVGQITGQAIVRLPYALYGPTIVTHFPLFQSEQDRSPGENDDFDKCKQRFKESVLDKKATVFTTNELAGFIGQQAEFYEQDVGAAEKAIFAVWNHIISALEKLFETNPEYFVFDARTLIDLEINRSAHDLVVSAIDPKCRRPTADLVSIWKPFDKGAFSIVNGALQIFLHQLHKALDGFKDNVDKPSQTSEAPPIATLDRLGGVVSWYNSRDILVEDHAFKGPGGRVFKRTDSLGRKLYALRDPFFPVDHEPVVDQYVIWRRGDKNWRYTFCEGSFAYHAKLEEVELSDRDYIVRNDLKNFITRTPVIAGP